MQPASQLASPKYDTSKAARDLGLTAYIPFHESLKDQCESLIAAGLVKL